jgi:hypothetical protein
MPPQVEPAKELIYSWSDMIDGTRDMIAETKSGQPNWRTNDAHSLRGWLCRLVGWPLHSLLLLTPKSLKRYNVRRGVHLTPALVFPQTEHFPIEHLIPKVSYPFHSRSPPFPRALM